MKKNLLAVLVPLVLPIILFSQTVSGLWYGTLVNDSTHRKQNFELGLSEYRGKITGYTYTTFIENDTFYYSIKKIRAERNGGTLIVTDAEMVANNFPEKAAKGVKQTTTFPLINDSTIDVANGRWSTNQTKVYYSLSGSVDVREQKDDKRSAMLMHLQEMNIKTNITSRKPDNKNDGMAVNNNKAIYQKEERQKQKGKDKQKEKEESIAKNNLPLTSESKVNKQPVVETENKSTTTAVVKNPEEKKPEPIAVVEQETRNRPQVSTTSVSVNSPSLQQRNSAVEKKGSLPPMVAERSNTTLEPVYFKGDSLVLALYDNGVVDGDTVTVYVNNESVLERIKLKEAATKKTIYIAPGTDSLQLVLFAENLGTIPPNTGLLTIRDGDDLYQVTFSADLRQNAAITLKRKRK